MSKTGRETIWNWDNSDLSIRFVFSEGRKTISADVESIRQ